MGDVSLKVLEKSLNFLSRNGYELCVLLIKPIAFFRFPLPSPS